MGLNPKPVSTRHGQYSAICPIHRGKKAILSIGTGSDGRVIFNCKKGCSYDAVAAALGISVRELFPHDDSGQRISYLRYDGLQLAMEDLAGKNGVTLVAQYQYINGDGTVAFVTARYENGTHKEFRDFSRNRNGRWRVKTPESNRPLYNLLSVRNARVVVVVEGEKCVDLASKKLGMAVVTSSHGANSPEKTDWSALAGKEVWIILDNDDAGEAYARKVARLLENLNPKCRVKIIRLTGLAGGEDIEQWFDRLPPDWTQSEIVEAITALAGLSAGPPRYDKIPGQEQRATDWLRERLSSGPIPSKEMDAMAEAAGFSKRTIARVKDVAGVTSKRSGPGWCYCLDSVPKDAKTNTASVPKNVKAGTKNASVSKNAKDAIKDAKPSNTWDKEKGSSDGDPGSAVDAGSVPGEWPQTGGTSDWGPPVVDPVTRPVVNPPSEPNPESSPTPTAEGMPVPNPDRCSEPVDALFALIRDHSDATERRVKTSKGPGSLWQVFRDSVRVVLDSDPVRVAFFSPAEVEVATQTERVVGVA